MTKRKIIWLIFGIWISWGAKAQDTIVPISEDTLIQEISEYQTNTDSISDTLQVSKTKKQAVNLFKTKDRSPKVAGWLSAALPGLGQAYNRKYWKLPIVYGGFAALGGLMYYYAKDYIAYRDEYRFRINNNDTIRLSLTDLETVNVEFEKQTYQRYMEYVIIGSVIWYLLNIVDAVVDAHLSSFNISDKLSMSVIPFVNPYQPLALNKQIPFNITFILTF